MSIIFKNKLESFLKISEEDGGGGGEASGPMTVASTGLPTSGEDAFKGTTYSNLEGATSGYYYDFSKKKKKKRKLKKIIFGLYDW